MEGENGDCKNRGGNVGQDGETERRSRDRRGTMRRTKVTVACRLRRMSTRYGDKAAATMIPTFVMGSISPPHRGSPALYAVRDDHVALALADAEGLHECLARSPNGGPPPIVAFFFFKQKTAYEIGQ